jgi:hypothetical protein
MPRRPSKIVIRLFNVLEANASGAVGILAVTLMVLAVIAAGVVK